MRLAVVGAFHRRHENTLPLLRRVLVESTRVPDETWVVCEDELDASVAQEAVDELGVEALIHVLPTPTYGGKYTRVPYSLKINWVLDRSAADLFTYLDNGSMPHPDKYRVMAEAFSDPEIGAVYCTQQRSGHDSALFVANYPVYDGFCVLNHTQVMNRAVPDRWPEDIASGNSADGVFWRHLNRRFGVIHPVGGDVVLDWHLIDGPQF